MTNNVKPTKKQEQTFKHMTRAKSLQEAMLKGGYSKSTSTHPKQNFIEREGTKTMIEKYRDDLIKAGISTELLAEIQAEGLFDQNAAVRLGYLKETKKDLGIDQPTGQNQINVQVNTLIQQKGKEYGF